MPYCFLDYRPAQHGGLEPDCPDHIAFLLLADYPGVGWGIFEVDRADDWTPTRPVGEALASLIESAKRYPPALALARHESTTVFGEDRPDQTQFEMAYRNALRHHLAQQQESSYVLAPALTDDVPDLIKGEWYWVVQVSGSPPTALWVSDDYHLYRNDLTDFDLTGQQLKALGFSG